MAQNRARLLPVAKATIKKKSAAAPGSKWQSWETRKESSQPEEPEEASEDYLHYLYGPEGEFTMFCPGCKKSFKSKGRPMKYTKYTKKELTDKLFQHLGAEWRKHCTEGSHSWIEIWNEVPVWFSTPEGANGKWTGREKWYKTPTIERPEGYDANAPCRAME